MSSRCTAEDGALLAVLDGAHHGPAHRAASGVIAGRSPSPGVSVGVIGSGRHRHAVGKLAGCSPESAAVYSRPPAPGSLRAIAHARSSHAGNRVPSIRRKRGARRVVVRRENSRSPERSCAGVAQPMPAAVRGGQYAGSVAELDCSVCKSGPDGRGHRPRVRRGGRAAAAVASGALRKTSGHAGQIVPRGG